LDVVDLRIRVGMVFQAAALFEGRGCKPLSLPCWLRPLSI
jgi:hypothetical protein